MSENHIPGSSITEEELARRKAALQDAYDFSNYIPDELRAQLEAGLTEEMRTAVLQLQILAIKYGRALEKRDRENEDNARLILPPAGKRPSNLAMQLVDRAGRQIESEKRDFAHEQIHRVNEDKKVDILVAPGFLDLTKKAGDREH